MHRASNGEDKLKLQKYIGECTQPKLKMSGSLRKPPRYLCFDFGTPTPCLREAGNGVVGRLVYVPAGMLLLLKAVKYFSFALLAISLLKQVALLYSINQID